MHIDMKLNFMHILADLGFGGVYPIYWIKESKHAIIYTWSKYACQDLQEPKEDTIWTKTKNIKKAHQSVICKRIVQIMSKTKTTHDWERYQKKRYQIKDISRNEITNSQREKDSNK